MRTVLLLFLAACGTDDGLMMTPDLAMSEPLPDMSTPPECDILAQNCDKNDKCVAAGTEIVCVNAGDVEDGMPCTRSMGQDNCAAGLLCSRTGVPNNMPACRKYCGSDADCNSNERCGQLRGVTAVGVCSPSCTPFGNDCPAQLNCSNLITRFGSIGGGIFFTCRVPGPTAAFDTCGNACVADSFCDANEGWCAPLCDDTHACPPTAGDGGAPVECVPLFNDLPTHPGYCAQP